MNRLFAFHLPNKNRIILHTANQLFKYTFLQSDLTVYTPQLITELNKSQINSMNIQPYQQMLRTLENKQFHDYLEQLQKKDISQEQLRQIIANKNNVSMIQFGKYYWQFKNVLVNNLRRKNIDSMLQIIGNMNYISLDVWEQILLIFKDNYQQSSIQTRLFWMTALKQYFSKFYHERSQNQQQKTNNISEYQDLSHHLKARYKFLIRQNCLKDVGDLRNIILNFTSKNETKFHSYNSQNSQNKQKIELLHTKFQFIHKISKATDLNFFSLKQHFQDDSLKGLIQFLQKNASKRQYLEFILDFYKFTNLIGINANEAILEKLLLEGIKSRQQSSEQNKQTEQFYKDSSIFTNKILSIWKFKGQYNKELFTFFIEPTIKRILAEHQSKKYYHVFAYNLLCCFQKQVLIRPNTWKEDNNQIIDLVIDIINRIRSQKMVSNRSIHIVQHFMKIYQLENKISKKDSNEPKKHYDCGRFQNELLLKKINELNYKTYSPCLELIKKSTPLLGNLSTKNQTNLKPATNTEYNSVQTYWQEIISLVVPKQNLINHCRFCSYQIDTLIITKKQLIGVEIQGIHYLTIQQQVSGQSRQISIPRTGKRQLRENILKSYHIKWLKIECWKKRQNYLMIMKNKGLSKMYIKQKLEQILGGSIQEFFE